MSSGSSPHLATLTHPTIPLEDSKLFCAKLTAAQARNFYYGMMLTPQPRRAAMYAIYAWMRAVDDLADAPASEWDDDVKRRHLEAFRRQTHAIVQHDGGWDSSPDAAPEPVSFAPMWPAVAAAFCDHHIPIAYLDAMIQGQLLDQEQTRYDSFAQLYEYCYKVASVVGLTCIEVWGYEGGEATRKLAEERGIALQLTNILRDLVEDAQRDRVYLPAEELARFRFDSESFKRYLLKPTADRDGDFNALMAMQIARARSYYDRTAALESHLTKCCRPTCWAMMKIYEQLLCKMEKQPRVVLTRRVKLNKFQKLWIAARAMLRRGLRG